jgi:anaerobic selenocysteine-containing dehydrogenase
MTQVTRRDAIKLGAFLALSSTVTVPFVKQQKDKAQQASLATAEKIPIMCNMCGAGCGLYLVRGEQGQFYVEPNLEHPQPGLCARAAASIQLWNHPLRLKKPLKNTGEKGNPKFQEIDWETALNEISAKLKDIISKYGPESVVFTYHDFYSWHTKSYSTCLLLSQR